MPSNLATSSDDEILRALLRDGSIHFLAAAEGNMTAKQQHDYIKNGG